MPIALPDFIVEEAEKVDVIRKLNECENNLMKKLENGEIKLDELIDRAGKLLLEDTKELNLLTPGFLGTLQAIHRTSRGLEIDEKTLERLVYDQLISEIMAAVTEPSLSFYAGVEANGMLLVNPLFYLCARDKDVRIAVLAHEAAHLLLGHHANVTLLPLTPEFLNLVKDAYVDLYLRELGFKKFRSFVTMKDVALNSIVYDRLKKFIAEHYDELKRVIRNSGDPQLKTLDTMMDVVLGLSRSAEPPWVSYALLSYLLVKYGYMLQRSTADELKDILVDAARWAEELEKKKLYVLANIICMHRSDVCDIAGHLESLSDELRVASEWTEIREVLERAARGEAKPDDIINLEDILSDVIGTLLDLVANDAVLIKYGTSSKSIMKAADELLRMVDEAAKKIARINDALARVVRSLESGAAAGDDARTALQEWESLASILSSIAAKARSIAMAEKKMREAWISPRGLELLSEIARSISRAMDELAKGNDNAANSEILKAYGDAKNLINEVVSAMTDMSIALEKLLESAANTWNIEAKNNMLRNASRLVNEMLRISAEGAQGDPRTTLNDAIEIAEELEKLTSKLDNQDFKSLAHAVTSLVKTAIAQTIRTRPKNGKRAIDYMREAIKALNNAAWEPRPEKRLDHIRDAIEYMKMAIEELSSKQRMFRLSEIPGMLEHIVEEYETVRKTGNVKDFLRKRIDEILDVAQALGVHLSPSQVFNNPEEAFKKILVALGNELAKTLAQYERLVKSNQQPNTVMV